MVSNGFSKRLLKWDKEANHRQMPWKGEKDPYRIWLSEIILQQTRVEQGLKYYNNFLEAFSTIHELAKAPETKIFKLWEGLGYYSRCRNLIHSARFIAKEWNGIFPKSYESLKMLKGVGPYTAAAISSFAFNLAYPVVDGNVYRVLSRIFGIRNAIDTTEGKKTFNSLANELLDKKEPGRYNQAIMDFGAMVCKPVAPMCGECIFRNTCIAFLQKKVNKLPVKNKQIRIRERWFYYIVITYKNRIAIRQRVENDIWQSLFEFPLVEKTKKINPERVIKYATKELGLSCPSYKDHRISSLQKQQLSHQKIWSYFLLLEITNKPKRTNDWIWVTKKELKKYTFPGIINRFLQGSIT